jgi:hypothetical protein
MLDQLFVGLVLAAFAGLTALAYREPRGYDRVQIGIVWLMSFCLAAAVAWDLAITVATMQILPLVDPAHFNQVENVLANLRVPLWSMVLAFAFSLYVTFLGFLPLILGRRPSV